jgi:toxin ParE1/3/4
MGADFNLTPRAKTDLENIWLYTLQTWSEAQADKYINDMFARFEWLAKQPKIVKKRDDVAPNYYSFKHRQHVVFYLIRCKAIDIIGIPHKQMDILNYFD